MYITLFSFLSALLWSSLMIVAVFIIRRKRFFRYHADMVMVVLLYALSAVRLLVPVEFSWTAVIEDDTVYPRLYRFLTTEAVAGPYRIDILTALAAIWAAGSFILMAAYIFRERRVEKRVKAVSTECGSDKYELLEEIKRMTGKNIRVQLREAEHLDTPFGSGIFSKYIVLPQQIENIEEGCEERREDEGDTDKDRLRYILLHEYTHFIDRDTALKLMINIYCIVFWFDPFVYLLKKDLSQTLEIKCDMAVSGMLDKKGRIEYLQTMLSFIRGAGGCDERPDRAAAFAGCSPEAEIKERFKAVMGYDRSSHDRAKKFAALTVTLIFAAAITCSYMVVPQPLFDAADGARDSIVEFDASDAYILETADGRYLLCISSQEPVLLSAEQAEFYMNTGMELRKQN